MDLLCAATLRQIIDRKSGQIELILEGIAVPKCKKLIYLRSLSMIDEDVIQRIKLRWLKMEKCYKGGM